MPNFLLSLFLEINTIEIWVIFMPKLSLIFFKKLKFSILIFSSLLDTSLDFDALKW